MHHWKKSQTTFFGKEPMKSHSEEKRNQKSNTKVSSYMDRQETSGTNFVKQLHSTLGEKC